MQTMLYVRIGLTAAALPFCGYILLSHASDQDTRTFASTTLGTVIGYWLGGSGLK